MSGRCEEVPASDKISSAAEVTDVGGEGGRAGPQEQDQDLLRHPGAAAILRPSQECACPTDDLREACGRPQVLFFVLHVYHFE